MPYLPISEADYDALFPEPGFFDIECRVEAPRLLIFKELEELDLEGLEDVE